MQTNNDSPRRSRTFVSARWPWLCLMVVTCLVVILTSLVLAPHREVLREGSSAPELATNLRPSAFSPNLPARPGARQATNNSEPTPEEVVAKKVKQFGRSRRRLAQAIARRSHTKVPPEVEAFFDALDRGKWEEIQSRWHELAQHSSQYDYSTDHWPELDTFWPSVLDAYGVAEQAHEWPAKKLLDYGNAVLGSLKPGMVYVGGTDNGRWIPELMDETSGGDPHIIITQNALADNRYLEFVNTLYSDRMSTLTSEESQSAFQAYVADAQKRLEHDQQFPDEPKQLRLGEDVKMVDGKAQVSGQIAVMSINERLLQALMQKNPDFSFAIQESFPFQGTYPTALPLGPLMELGANQNDFTAERAAQSLQYWQNTAQEVLADPEAANSSAVVRSYSHDAVAAANLLAAHNFTSDAEQTYRLAVQLCPESPESVGRLANLLAANGRETEGKQMLEDFARKYPDAAKEMTRLSSLWRAAGSTPPPGH